MSRARFSPEQVQEMLRTRPGLLQSNPGLVSEETRKLLPNTPERTEELRCEKFEGLEKELQQQVESLLRRQGFYPRTPEWIGQVANPDRRGWYGHWPNTKKNPIVLDLLVWVDQGPCCEFELKAEGGRISDEQEKIISAGNPVFWNYAGVLEFFRKWLETQGLSWRDE